MNRLSRAKRVQILGLMLEDVSIRAISRMTGASKNTIVKLLGNAGERFSEYQHEHVRHLKTKSLQLDVTWSFGYPTGKNLSCAKSAPEVRGDVWTWTALDAESKLIVSWIVGDRSEETASKLVQDVADRQTNPIQITADGYRPYVQAVQALGPEIPIGLLQTFYSMPAQVRPAGYSPGECSRTLTRKISAQPDTKHILTSLGDRQNLPMRTSFPRFTHLTNAFSKKIENHGYAIAIYFMHYNFCRIHQTLHVTPAMEAGIADHRWSLEELAALLESN